MTKSLGPYSLRNRLSLVLSLVLLAASALLAFGLQDFPRRLVEDYVLSRLQHDADLLYVRVLDAADADAAAQAAAGTVYQLPLSGHYFAIRQGGRTIRSRSLWDEEIELAAPPERGETVGRQPGPAGQTLLVFTKHFPAAGDGIVITVAEDLVRLDTAVAAFGERMLIGLALALVVLLVVQRRLLVRGLAPLDEAVDACRRLERGETSAVEIPAPTEVRPILDAVNRLARHQARRLGRVRHTVGNVSHALKTPLAVLAQCADELAASGACAQADAIRTQLELMRATIERELRRARLAGRGPGAGFDPRPELETLVTALKRLHAGREIAFELDISRTHLAFDREDMLELFDNLLDNACKWARSRVRVGVAIRPAGDGRGEPGEHVEFRVDDDGPGVPAGMLERLGTAGLRGDQQRPGHGLGLAIVGDIVAQYGGTIRYARSAALGGLSAVVRVPLQAPPTPA